MLQLLSWRSPTEKDQGLYYFASCIFVPRELQTMLHTSVFPARICIWLVLQCAHEDFFGLLAIVCSSWVPINIATSKRSVVLPEGNTSLSYVANANCMCSRCLGLQLCVCTVYCHSIYSRSQGHSVVLFFTHLECIRSWWCCVHQCVSMHLLYSASKNCAHLCPHCGKRGNLFPGAAGGILHGILWQNEMALWTGSSAMASRCENITWYVMTTNSLKQPLCAYMVHV